MGHRVGKYGAGLWIRRSKDGMIRESRTQDPLLRWASLELRFDRLVSFEASMGRRIMLEASWSRSWSSNPLYIRGHISDFSLVTRSKCEAQWFRWAILEALSFRLKDSKASLERVAIGMSEAPLVTLRRSDVFLSGEVRTQAPFLQRDPSETARDWMWISVPS